VNWCLDEVTCARLLKVDDEKVVSGSYDRTLKVWDIKTGQCRRTLRSQLLSCHVFVNCHCAFVSQA